MIRKRRMLLCFFVRLDDWDFWWINAGGDSCYCLSPFQGFGVWDEMVSGGLAVPARNWQPA